jgi:hypothetical protein
LLRAISHQQGLSRAGIDREEAAEREELGEQEKGQKTGKGGGEAFESEEVDWLCGAEVALYHHAGLLLTLLRHKPALASVVAKEAPDDLREGLCKPGALNVVLFDAAPTHAQLRLNRRSASDLAVVVKVVSRVLGR